MDDSDTEHGIKRLRTGISVWEVASYSSAKTLDLIVQSLKKKKKTTPESHIYVVNELHFQILTLPDMFAFCLILRGKNAFTIIKIQHKTLSRV